MQHKDCHPNLIPGRGLASFTTATYPEANVTTAKISMESRAIKQRMTHAYILSS